MSNIILLQKDIINKLDDDELCVYLAVKYIAKQEKECFITYGHIDYVLFGREGTRAEKAIVSSGLKKIVDKKYINIISTIRGYGYVCDAANLNVYDKVQYYASLTHTELQKIISIDGCNRYNLLRYFLVIVGTFVADKQCDDKYRFKVGYMPRSYIAEMSNIDIATADKYNKILEDNHLIYVARRKTYDNKSQVANWQTNIYSRYQDNKLCEEYAKSVSAVVDTKTYKKQIDESRRYIQMYNAMVKGKIYDVATVADIYEAVQTWNEDKKRKYEDQIAQGYCPAEPKYKDLSIFDKYKLD